MFLDNFLDLRLLKVRELILFHVKDNLGTTSETRTISIEPDGEGSASAGLPNVLLVIVGFGNDFDFVGNQVCGVETNTELTYDRCVSAWQHETLYNLPIMEISAPADRASMNCLVPDRAMVPRLLTRSDFVKPIPVS